ncbi:hypothetical protein NOCA2280006 [metagenome]|uniref:Methyltransferase type 12 n=1 Tax=metagenome TaxID=256318 RepID=A0A2P2C0P7_9ZZZZ
MTPSSASELHGVDHLLVLCALPDDERVAAAGLIRAARRLGVSTEVLVADGGPGRDDREETIVDVLCRRLTSYPDPGRTLLGVPWRHGTGDREAAGRAASVAAARTGVRLVQYDARDPESFVVSEPGEASEVFEGVHVDAEDPWGVDERWYEERKRALTVAALPRRRFQNALELGCSVGALSADLAERCERLLAVDASESAVQACGQRLRAHPGASVEQRVIPAQWPEGSFDLVVMSESGYFLTPLQLETTLERIAGSLTADGVVVACHWRHPIRGWPLDGELVHERMLEAFADQSIEMLALHLEPDFVLHVFGRDAGVLPDPQALR